MPYSIFFDGGYAIHGSYEIKHLGRPASHGCVRLHPENAALLFALVKEHVDDTTIVITGERPEPVRTREDDKDEPRRVHRAHRTRETALRREFLPRPVDDAVSSFALVPVVAQRVPSERE